MNTQIDHSLTLIFSVADKISNLKDQINQIGYKFPFTLYNINILQEQIDQTLNKLNEFKLSLLFHYLKLEKPETEADQLQNQINLHQDQINQIQSWIDQQKDNINQQQGIINQQQNGFDTKQDEIDQSQEAINKKQVQLNEEQNNLSDEQAVLSQKRDLKKLLRDKLSNGDTNDTLEALQTELERQKSEFLKLKENLDSEIKKFNFDQIDINELRSSIISRQLELAQLLHDRNKDFDLTEFQNNQDSLENITTKQNKLNNELNNIKQQTLGIEPGQRFSDILNNIEHRMDDLNSRIELNDKYTKISEQDKELKKQQANISQQEAILKRRKDILYERDEVQKQIGELDNSLASFNLKWGKLNKRQAELYQEQSELYKEQNNYNCQRGIAHETLPKLISILEKYVQINDQQSAANTQQAQLQQGTIQAAEQQTKLNFIQSRINEILVAINQYNIEQQTNELNQVQIQLNELQEKVLLQINSSSYKVPKFYPTLVTIGFYFYVQLTRVQYRVKSVISLIVLILSLSASFLAYLINIQSIFFKVILAFIFITSLFMIYQAFSSVIPLKYSYFEKCEESTLHKQYDPFVRATIAEFIACVINGQIVMPDGFRIHKKIYLALKKDIKNLYDSDNINAAKANLRTYKFDNSHIYRIETKNSLFYFIKKDWELRKTSFCQSASKTRTQLVHAIAEPLNFIKQISENNVPNNNAVNSNNNAVNSNNNAVNSNNNAVNSNDSTVNSNDSTVNSNDSTVNSNDSTVNSNDSTVNSNDSTVNSNDSTVNSNDNPRNPIYKVLYTTRSTFINLPTPNLLNHFAISFNDIILVTE